MLDCPVPCWGMQLACMCVPSVIVPLPELIWRPAFQVWTLQGAPVAPHSSGCTRM